ncbi:MAG: hypothetical protein WAU83_13200 [Pseudonocardiaceae bacterium]
MIPSSMKFGAVWCSVTIDGDHARTSAYSTIGATVETRHAYPRSTPLKTTILSPPF